jgi:hypothetical protein
MKKYLLLLFCFLLTTVITSAQSKIKAPAKLPENTMQKLLTGTGLPFTMASDSLAVVPYKGENISSYQVLVQKIGDLYIIYTNLTDALGNIEETKFKYLLQQNDHFDIIKIGLNNDNVIYIRADVYRANMNTTLLARIIKQVANVTNIIGGDLNSQSYKQ